MPRTRTDPATLKFLLAKLIHISGVEMELDHTEQGYRVYMNGGSKPVSPRLRPKQMVEWLEAATLGVELTRKAQRWR